MDANRKAKMRSTGSLVDRIDRLIDQCRGEAILAMARIRYECEWGAAKRRHEAEQSRMCRERDVRGHGHVEYAALQTRIDTHARTPVEWDPAKTPLLLFHSGVVEAIAGTKPAATWTTPKAWERLLQYRLLHEKRMDSLLPPELSAWAPISKTGGNGRKRTSEMMRAAGTEWAEFERRVEGIVGALEDRSQRQRLADLFAVMSPLHCLHHALSWLRSELGGEDKGLDDEAMAFVLQQAREGALCMKTNWPCGACEGVALDAIRADTPDRLNRALAALARDERPSDLVPVLTAGMDLIDAYAKPYHKWPDVPLPPPPASQEELDTEILNRPEKSNVFYRATHNAITPAQFRDAVPPLKSKKISQRVRLYLVRDVVTHPTFSTYRTMILDYLRSPPPRKQRKE